MDESNNNKFTAKGKKVTLVLKGKDGYELRINTSVKKQFGRSGYKSILRCDIMYYVMSILRMEEPLKIVYLNINGKDFDICIRDNIDIYTSKDILLPILEIVISSNTADKIDVYNAYVDKISYIATHKALAPYTL